MPSKTINKLRRLKRQGLGLFILLMMLALSLTANGQPSDPGGGDCGSGPDDACPIDTWILLLVVLGLFFGYRQIQRQKNRPVIN